MTNENRESAAVAAPPLWRGKPYPEGKHIGLVSIGDLTDMEPVHDVDDEEKLAYLVESMRENGWRGAPLVAHGTWTRGEWIPPYLRGGRGWLEHGRLLTGSHRWAAVRQLEGTDSWWGVPVVDIRDVFEEAGVALEAAKSELGLDDFDWHCQIASNRWLDYADLVSRFLPGDVQEEYGLQFG